MRVGPYLAVADTAPIGPDGRAAYPGDVHAQTTLCLDVVRRAVEEAGGSLAHVIRTCVMPADIRCWREAARAHGEVFGAVRPACTFVQVVRFIDPQWLVEVEAGCVIPTQAT